MAAPAVESSPRLASGGDVKHASLELMSVSNLRTVPLPEARAARLAFAAETRELIPLVCRLMAAGVIARDSVDLLIADTDAGAVVVGMLPRRIDLAALDPICGERVSIPAAPGRDASRPGRARPAGPPAWQAAPPAVEERTPARR